MSNLDHWKPSAAPAIPGPAAPVGHVPMALRNENGRDVEEEPRWHTLPGGLAATLPAPETELDSWVYDPQTLRSSTTGEVRQEVIAFRLSPTTLIEATVVRPLEPKGTAYRPAGPWVVSKCVVYVLEQVGPVLTIDAPPVDWARTVLGSASRPASPQTGTLEEAIEAAPQSMKDLLPPANGGYRELSWGLEYNSGSWKWSQLRRSRTAVGWVHCSPQGFRGGSWRIVSERPVESVTAALSQGTAPSLSALPSGKRFLPTT